jgi:hypothetical protein
VHLGDAANAGSFETVGIGRSAGKTIFTGLEDLHALMERGARRPKAQPWLAIREVAQAMAYLDSAR